MFYNILRKTDQRLIGSYERCDQNNGSQANVHITSNCQKLTYSSYTINQWRPHFCDTPLWLAFRCILEENLLPRNIYSSLDIFYLVSMLSSTELLIFRPINIIMSAKFVMFSLSVKRSVGQFS